MKLKLVMNEPTELALAEYLYRPEDLPSLIE